MISHAGYPLFLSLIQSGWSDLVRATTSRPLQRRSKFSTDVNECWRRLLKLHWKGNLSARLCLQYFVLSFFISSVNKYCIAWKRKGKVVFFCVFSNLHTCQSEIALNIFPIIQGYVSHLEYCVLVQGIKLWRKLWYCLQTDENDSLQ